MRKGFCFWCRFFCFFRVSVLFGISRCLVSYCESVIYSFIVIRVFIVVVFYLFFRLFSYGVLWG